MKIAVLTNDYAPNSKGGGAVIAETQVRELERRGHEIKVFVRSPNLEALSAISRLFFHLRDLGARSDIVSQILEWQPQILLTHNLTGCGFHTPSKILRQQTTCSPLRGEHRKLQNVKKNECSPLRGEHGGQLRWVHILHDAQLVEPSGQIVSGEIYKFARNIWRLTWATLRKFALANPDTVISPTNWLLNFHKQYGFFRISRTFVIPNPISQNLESGIQNLEPGTQNSNLDILFVGRLDPDKGIDVLIRALRSLNPNDVRLHIVGDNKTKSGPRTPDAGRNILYYGALPHDRVLEILDQKPLVVIPSLVYENQPTIILEALAAGCQVIASNVGGIPETLDGAGWIIPAGDEQALANAIKHALTNSYSENMNRARQTILNRHKLETVVDELESALKSNL
ncbi:MAG: glycosyltransferase family 4 protein [Patescibacteria group bacterium]|nr:glycosyltransferase family 4 protein [Patescibacteria group bacterium]MBU2509103.1 glycosyltransferase family 4 protein [Patescibacteria group bacterium]